MSQSPMFCLTFHFLNSVLVSAAVLTSLSYWRTTARTSFIRTAASEFLIDIVLELRRTSEKDTMQRAAADRTTAGVMYCFTNRSV